MPSAQEDAGIFDQFIRDKPLAGKCRSNAVGNQAFRGGEQGAKAEGQPVKYSCLSNLGSLFTGAGENRRRYWTVTLTESTSIGSLISSTPSMAVTANQNVYVPAARPVQPSACVGIRVNNALCSTG